jgi:hypothetical protein
MVKLICIIEIDEPTANEAAAKLDTFREATMPMMEYGLTIYRAYPSDVDGAVWADGTWGTRRAAALATAARRH